MKIEDIEKLENMAKEHEVLSDKAHTKGIPSVDGMGLEKHRLQADHLRRVCKELRERAEI